jgi:hypothetical protein
VVLYCICILKCSVENSLLVIKKTCNMCFYKFLTHLRVHHTTVETTVEAMVEAMVEATVEAKAAQR